MTVIAEQFVVDILFLKDMDRARQTKAEND